MNTNEGQVFIANVISNTDKFLENMHLGDGIFKFSYNDDLYNPNIYGLPQTAFAAKLSYILNDKFIQNNGSLFVKRILEFKKSDGTIYDPLIIKKIKYQSYKKIFKTFNLAPLNIEKYIRAETRQAYEALYLLGYIIEEPYKIIPVFNNKNLEKYFKSLDWSNPWDAGSHLSGLIFFLTYCLGTKKIDGKTFANSKETIFSYIREFQHDDGFWYNGLVQKNVKINGLMKLLLGFHCINDFSLIKKPDVLIDECLKFDDGNEACDHMGACDYMNLVWCLYSLSKLTNYKFKETQNFMLKILDTYSYHYFPNLGGFSYNVDTCSTGYLGVKLTYGGNYPDLHGTYILMWGLALISEMLGYSFNIRHPVPQLITN